MPAVVTIASLKKRAATLKYAVNSVVATQADFITFHLLHEGMSGDAVFATFGGNTVGAGVSFLLLQRWVYPHAAPDKMRRRLTRFALGVAVSTAANVALMSALHHWSGWAPWPSRIGAAGGAWGIGYWFNQNVVFKKAENEPEYE